MYTVKVRQHMMIAHSLPDPFFGPAAQLHGATYVVDAEFLTERLTDKNVVIDIGAASDILGQVLGTLNYSNLDSDARFAGQLTTTEFLAEYIHGRVSAHIAGQFNGRLRVTLNESHVAAASYEGPVQRSPAA